MMLWGGTLGDGALELRRRGDGGARLEGRFPYNRNAILSDGGRTGRPRKERFAPGAFAFRLEDLTADLHLLFGHSYDRPLASRATKTLTFRDTAEALFFDATITPEIAATQHGRDALALIGAGLSVGVSPGFRIPPKRAVTDAEEFEDEADDGSLDEDGSPRRGAIIRTVKQALLYEMSLVTIPAYSEAQIEARSWLPSETVPDASGLHRTLNRWRR